MLTERLFSAGDPSGRRPRCWIFMEMCLEYILVRNILRSEPVSFALTST